MSTPGTNRLQLLLKNNQQSLIKKGLKGIEKESLRLSRQGFISQLAHPKQLGSALTHPHITTDYSEALLEFITPPLQTSMKHSGLCTISINMCMTTWMVNIC